MNESPFSTVIGQTTAKARLESAVQSAENGGPALSPLITGPKGNGKTHIAEAYCRGLEDIGFAVLRTQPDDIRTEDGARDMFSLVTSGDRFCIWIDETHLLRDKETVWGKRARAMLMRLLDRNNHNKPILLVDDETATFNPTKGVFIATTNFPNKLDSSGAMQSRFDSIQLDLYTEDELIGILELMLNAEGFVNLNEKTLRLIAQCGRGTARPMEKIVQQLSICHKASGKRQQTLNREEVLKALIMAQMFPLGVSHSEVEILIRARNKRMLDRTILAAIPSMDRIALRDSKGYLTESGFLHETSSGVQTTDRGGRFLESLKRDKFTLPTIREAMAGRGEY